MALTAIGDVYQVTILGTLLGQRTMTTFYYRLDTHPGGATVKNAADTLDINFAGATSLYGRYASVCPSNWTASQMWAQRVLPVRTVKNTYDELFVGQSPNAATVSNVSASITRRAETADRSSVGGVRIPLSPADCVNGGLNAARLLAAQDLAVEMTEPLTAVVGWSFTPGFMRTTPLPVQVKQFQPIFSCTAEFTSRVMRRRTVGLGI